MSELNETKFLRETAGLTYQFLNSSYGQLKQWYPSICNAVEGQIGSKMGYIQPIVESLETRATPLFDSLDNKVSPLVTQHVQPLVSKGIQKGIQRKDELVTKKEELVTRAVAATELAKQKKEEFITSATEASVLAKQKKDELIETTKEQWGSFKAKSTQHWEGATKATAKRIESSLDSLSAFTSEQSMNFLKIDLIEYSKQFIETKKPLVESMYASFEDALENAKPSHIKERVCHDYPKSVERIDHIRVELKTRLDAAIARARWLSDTSIAAPSYAYQVAMNSPALYQEVKAESFKRMQESAGEPNPPDASDLVKAIGPYNMVKMVLLSIHDVVQASFLSQQPVEMESPAPTALAPVEEEEEVPTPASKESQVEA